MSQFGDTAVAHVAAMDILWGPAANIAIFLAQYSYRRYPFFVHALFGLVVCIFTLATTIPMLLFTGVVQPDSTISEDFNGKVLNCHYIVGITCLVAVSIVTILGIISKVVNITGGRSSTIIAIRKIHQFLGLAIVILCKANIYIIAPTEYVILGQDIAFALLYITWKFVFPRMESKISPEVDSIADIVAVTSISKISKENDYCIFANLVYDLQAVKLVHPGGYEVIDSVKNREIDRYIYGMYSSQFLPSISKHSHSANFYKLLGLPVARIAIPAPFSGLANREIAVGIETLELISEEGGIYEMCLKRTDGINFIYKGYTSLQQLGRYYSLTYNGKTTRLYTSVNFLIKNNKEFMKQMFDLKEFAKPIQTKSLQIEIQLTIYPVDGQIDQQQRPSEYLPILFKMYKNGRFTESLVKDYHSGNPNLMLSEPKGEGLQLGQLKAGKIILVAGGTGLYPFSDLIDLLFKESLGQMRPQLKEEILKLSPILASVSFQRFSFHLMGAFRHSVDLHPITIQQLKYLTTHHPHFSLTLKMKGAETLFPANVKMHTGSFGSLLSKELKEKGISKIYVCGPPKMNEELCLILREEAEEQQFTIM